MHASNQANKEFFVEKIEKKFPLSSSLYLWGWFLFGELWQDINSAFRQQIYASSSMNELMFLFFFRRLRYSFDFCCNAFPDAFPYPFLPLCILIPYWCLWRFYLFVYGFFSYAVFHIPIRIGDPRKKLAKRWLKWY